MLFISIRSSGSSLLTTIGLQYFFHGPTINVEYYKFLSTYQNQTCVLKQNSFCWHYMKTTAYYVTKFQDNILSYIQGCVESTLREACAF